MNVLVLNAGSASLKFEAIAVSASHANSDWGRKLVSGTIESIGNEATFSLMEGKNVVHQEKIAAQDYEEATRWVLEWLDTAKPGVPTTQELDLIGHRVVHGGDRFAQAAKIDDEVVAAIEELEDLAPLHNASAASVIRAARNVLSSTPMVAVFDTVFHRTIPKYASTYAISPELANRHRIRRYGFHGISHHYMMQRYAQITNRPSHEVSIVTLHLESGCSACAIRKGQSVDTSMGFTPLEGLVMGKRSGDIDPAVVGYLARKEGVEVGEVGDWLNKKSGLFGLSGLSHDTRVLMEQFDTNERVQLAMEVFCYRVRKYVGAYLAALEGAEAIVFGGGIGENTVFVRNWVCNGLGWCGLVLDSEHNEQTINCEGRITTDSSHLHAYVIPVEEGLTIAQQAVQCLGNT